MYYARQCRAEYRPRATLVSWISFVLLPFMMMQGNCEQFWEPFGMVSCLFLCLGQNTFKTPSGIGPFVSVTSFFRTDANSGTWIIIKTLTRVIHVLCCRWICGFSALSAAASCLDASAFICGQPAARCSRVDQIFARASTIGVCTRQSTYRRTGCERKREDPAPWKRTRYRLKFDGQSWNTCAD